MFHQALPLARPADVQDALAEGKWACATAPDNDEAYAGLGNRQTELGHLADARRSLRRAIAIDPKAAHFGKLAKAGRFAAGDPLIERLRQLLDGAWDVSEDDRAMAEFALGKAYDDIGRPAESFERFAAGNRRVRSGIVYDEAAALALVGSIAPVFTADFLAARTGLGDPSPEPVFIVGMPRSGSTLIERILANHPAVGSLGESNLFAEAKNEELGSGDCLPFPHIAPTLDPCAFRRIGLRYAARLRARAPSSARTINKMPGNFAYLGLIALALPGAKIIYPRRDPMDTCLSCYCELFAEGHPYAYDLRELARFWKACDGLMRHWRAVLPAGMLLEVEYEALTGDPEREARRMLDHLGLDWDPACLDFAEAPGTVRTASAAQVRQPVHRESVGRWRRFEPFLAELRDELAKS